MIGNNTGRAFLGSFTSAGGLGVTAASVDRETGALTVLGSTDAVPNPSFLAVGPRRDGAVLYAVGESAPGVAAAFAVDGDVPTLLTPAQAVDGDAPTHLALVANHLVTANYTSGSVTALPVLADGSLGAAASVLRHEGSGPDTGRQEAPHAHQVLADPSGNWLVSVDLGTDSVRVCALDPPPAPCGCTARRRCARAPGRATWPSTPRAPSPTSWASWSRSSPCADGTR